MLLKKTIYPFACNSFEYGGDDLVYLAEKHNKKDGLVIWLNELRNEYKGFLDNKIPITQEFLERHDAVREKVIGLLTDEFESEKRMLECLFSEYESKRMELVGILGVEMVKKIPDMDVPIKYPTGYITNVSFEREPKTPGVRQYEDYFGRKGLIFQVIPLDNFYGNGVKYLTIHQRMRETASIRGGLWVTNCGSFGKSTTSETFAFLGELLEGKNEYFKLVDDWKEGLE